VLGMSGRDDANAVEGHDDLVKIFRAALPGIVLFVLFSGSAGASASSLAPIQVRVVLQHNRVVAGQPIKGTVTLTNTSSNDITVQSCARNGWLQVGLKGRGYTFRASTTLIACPPSVRLIPGGNRFAVTVHTTYQACSQAGWESVTSPPCRSTGPPPLPAGMYSTSVFILGLAHETQAPRAITVTLLRPPEPKTSPTSAPRCPTCPTHPAFGPTPIRR
jgi:hypothetical protein